MNVQGFAYHLIPNPAHFADKTRTYSLTVLETDNRRVPTGKKVPLTISKQLLDGCRCDPHTLTGTHIGYEQGYLTLRIRRPDATVVREELESRLITSFPHAKMSDQRVLLSEREIYSQMSYDGVLTDVFRYHDVGQDGEVSESVIALLSPQSPRPEADVRVEFSGLYPGTLQGVQDYLQENLGHPLCIDRTVERVVFRRGDDGRCSAPGIMQAISRIMDVATGEEFTHVGDLEQ